MKEASVEVCDATEAEEIGIADYQKNLHSTKPCLLGFSYIKIV
jgi:hypothetical protein